MTPDIPPAAAATPPSSSVLAQERVTVAGFRLRHGPLPPGCRRPLALAAAAEVAAVLAAAAPGR